MRKTISLCTLLFLTTIFPATRIFAQTGILTMRTIKKVGDIIELEMKAGGSVTIEGASGIFESGKKVSYTITAQTITIRGNVTDLNCRKNRLTMLDVSKAPDLIDLDCGQNLLKALDLTGNPALTKLFCFQNQLSDLDLSRNTKLAQLTCYQNQLTDLDVSRNTELSALSCSQNSLTTLDISKNTALTALYCYQNRLTALDVSKNLALKVLSCFQNELSNCDITGNTALTRLYCGKNRLTTLDISQNKELTELLCYGNLLTSLDLSRNTSLTTFYCDQNQLTALDVSQNKKLVEFGCPGNKIKGEAMERLINSLPKYQDPENLSGREGLYIINSKDENEQNVCTQIQVAAAKAKGWKVYDLNGNGANRQEYNGYGGVITLTTNKAAGEKIKLKINADSPVKISGATGNFEQGKYTDYTITSRTITVCGEITEFYCPENQLTDLDISKNTMLTVLDCRGNQIKDAAMDQLITSLPQHQNPESPSGREGLYVINSKDDNEQNLCTKAQIAAAKEKGWRVYDYTGDFAGRQEYEGCEDPAVGKGIITMTTNKNIGEKITLRIDANGSVAVTGATGKFEYGELSDYTLTSQTIIIRGDVTAFDCSKNELTALNISENPDLSRLTCYKNQLKELDTSRNKTLTVLSCGQNQLTALNVSANPDLAVLYCHQNELKELVVAANSALTRLDCYQNQLTSLTIPKNSVLTVLRCYQNQIKESEMGVLINALPQYQEPEDPTGKEGIYVINTKDSLEKNICTKDQVAIAKAKGWKVYDFYGGWTSSKEYEGSSTSVEKIAAVSPAVYPNPANDFIRVEGAGAHAELRLYTLSGRQVFSGETDDSGTARLALKGLAAGSYLLQTTGKHFIVIVK